MLVSWGLSDTMGWDGMRVSWDRMEVVLDSGYIS